MVCQDAINPQIQPYSVDAVISSMSLHEILSYGDVGNGQFDHKSIEIFLKRWLETLTVGGRFILRDFCKPENGSETNV